jgi:quercetin dioxygenase-like cupin family protein
VPQQFLVSSDDGERADFPVLGNRFVLSAEVAEERFALVEHRIAPRALAAPTHSHQREDEYSYVLTGRVGAEVGDQTVEAGPGELIVKPRGIPHAFWNAGHEEARLLEIISPAGFERYFAEAAPLLSGDGPPDLEAMAALQGRYGLEMDFASVGPLCERHGLTPPGPPPGEG